MLHTRCLSLCAGRDPLIDVALALEKAARSDEYFVKRKLYPNVDFFSGARAGWVAGLCGLCGGGAAWLNRVEGAGAGKGQGSALYDA